MAMMMPGGIASQAVLPPLQGTVPAYAMPAKRQVDESGGNKIRRIVMATLAFAVLSHMAAYKIAETVYGAFSGSSYQIIAEEGGITLKGTLVMTAVFFILMIYLMA
jgi:hypothetical protein